MIPRFKRERHKVMKRTRALAPKSNKENDVYTTDDAARIYYADIMKSPKDGQKSSSQAGHHSGDESGIANGHSRTAPTPDSAVDQRPLLTSC